jgi:protein subunit release factor B
MIDEIHLTKKDFKLEWFSGQGAGGQHRNKHQNCCRITHVESGLKVQGTESRERVTNQRVAFNKLAKMVIAWYQGSNKKNRYNAIDTIRNYHAVRNEVHDKASGLKQSYKKVVDGCDLSDMIEARKAAAQ